MDLLCLLHSWHLKGDLQYTKQFYENSWSCRASVIVWVWEVNKLDFTDNFIFTWIWSAGRNTWRVQKAPRDDISNIDKSQWNYEKKHCNGRIQARQTTFVIKDTSTELQQYLLFFLFLNHCCRLQPAIHVKIDVVLPVQQILYQKLITKLDAIKHRLYSLKSNEVCSTVATFTEIVKGNASNYRENTNGNRSSTTVQWHTAHFPI